MSSQIPASTYLAVTVLSLLSVVTALIGALLALQLSSSKRSVATGIGFSAGIMLLISCFELIPEAIQHAALASSLFAVVSGAVGVAILDWAIPHAHLFEERGGIVRAPVRTAYLIAFGLILHDVPEGIAMANAYVASPSLGLLVAIAIAAHNLPEEFAMAVPIASIENKRFLFTAAFLSALAEPLGAALGLIAVTLHPAFNPLFMAFAAGTMLYVSLHELLPMARRYGNIPSFVLGLVLSALFFAVLRVFLRG